MDLREAFLNYFDRKGHHVCASTSLIPEGDPSLLFTSAGMVPFKPYFLGVKTGIDRAASCQKSFRTSDIDRVGATLRHLTFFEMLGNFSFGDYFKAEAIAFAWEFCTKTLSLDPKRLHITVFKDDDEAEKLWKKHGPRNPIVRLGEEDNFWNMGPTGPCGPCSEIYYDFGPEMGKGPENVVGGDGDRYIEFWNLVFTQFDRQPDNSLRDLPRKNIDTGLGLERLTMIMEEKSSPFQTGLFDPIRRAAADLLGVPAPDFRPGMAPKDDEAAMAYRIISDHTRGAVFLASEGIIPSNVERGYVLRRLIRRAARYGRLLGAKEPFLHTLVEPTLSIFGRQYPELAEAQTQIRDTLRAEEERFLETLERGERELHDLLEGKPSELPGAEAFKLYDTYGFPLELTKEICARNGVKVDETGFTQAQMEAVETARAGWKGTGESAAADYEKIAAEIRSSQFVGYRKMSLDTQVAWVIKTKHTSDSELRTTGASQTLEPGDEGEVILTTTPFYPAGGGQVGDKGVIYDDVTDKILAEVLDTHKPHPKLIVHKVLAHKVIRPNMRVRAEVDQEMRRKTAYHHTATHLMNAALRKVLGDMVRQAGSYVAPDRLRFDFTHPRPMAKEEIAEVERLVNEAITADYEVSPKELPSEEIKKIKPVTLLGENYGAKPRFLLVNKDGWKSPMERYSLELCGGTHVQRTGEIQSFQIVRESSAAAGIRRIEAVAGPALAHLKMKEEEKLRQELRDCVENYIILTSKIQSVSGHPFRDVVRGIPDADTAAIPELRKAIERLRAIERKLKSQLENLKRENLFQQAKMGQVYLEVGSIKLSAQKFDQAEIQTLRKIQDQVKRDMGTGVVFLGSTENNKLSFVIGVTQDLVGKGLDASRMAKAVAELAHGRAGGRKDFAQGGGPETDWEALVNKVKELISSASS